MRKLLLSGVALLLSTGAASAQVLDEIIVTGKGAHPVPKIDQSVIDTAQTITVVTPEVLHEQAVTSLHEALINVPEAQAHADEDSQQGDNFYIRGFSAYNDVYLDGIRNPGHYKQDTFNMQSLEVLVGPSGATFGRGSTGGVINFVTKSPQLDPITAGTVMLGTDDTKRFTGDVDMPIGPDAAFRINFVGHDAGFAGRDVVEYSRFGIAPAVSFGIATDTRVTLKFLHQSEYDIPDFGVPWIYTPGNVRPFYTSKFYGSENSDFARANADMATMFVEHDLNDWLTFQDQFGYGTFERNMQVTEPAGANPDGNELVTVPLSQAIVENTTRGVRSQETTIQNQADFHARFDIGPVSEDLVAGFDISRDTTSPTTFKYTGSSESLLNPDPSIPFMGVRTLKSDITGAAVDDGVYALSTTNWENWGLNLSARFDRFAATYNNSASAPAQNLHHTDQLPSFRGAVLYHPVPDATLYFSYGTSFDPSAEALSLSTATAALAPQKTRSAEIGAKYSPTPGLLATVALFRTLQFNLREADPFDPTTDILIGGARAEGIDISLTGEVADHWKVWGGYQYLVATVISSPNGDVGNRLQQAPRHSGRIWTSYEFLDNKLEVGAGFVYVGNRTPTTIFEFNNIMQVAPSYYTVGLMAGYRVTDWLRVQLNIDNLNGSKYFDGIDDNHVNQGEGRTAFLTARFSL